MILLPSRVARQWATLVRRAGVRSTTARVPPLVQLLADDQGTRLRLVEPHCLLEYHDPTPVPHADSCYLPLDWLTRCGNASDEQVQIGILREDRLTATWQRRGVPQTLEQPAPTPPTWNWPTLPAADQAVVNPPRLWAALRTAVATLERDSSRLALDCLRLAGPTGELAATDGRQIFVETGFEFPWNDTQVVCGHAALGSRELDDLPVAVTQHADWIVLGLGPWRFGLKLERERRFPQIEQCLPPLASARCQIELAADDARFLADRLEELPGHDEPGQPVTLELNRAFVVRARSREASRPVELRLTNSCVQGEAVRLVTDRQYLRRMLDLELRHLACFGPDQPLVATGHQRQYVWALLASTGAVAPTTESHVIASPPGTPDRPPRTRSRTLAAVPPELPTPQPTRSTTSPDRTIPLRAIVTQASDLRNQLRQLTRDASQLVRQLRTAGRSPRRSAPSPAALPRPTRAAS